MKNRIAHEVKAYLSLTKFGIVIFVLFGGLVGYSIGFSPDQPFSIYHFLQFLIGLYLLSSGIFALNQIQEVHLDMLMPRTAVRPIPVGHISRISALVLSTCFILSSLIILYFTRPMLALFGLITMALYNGFYTLSWKPKWAFAAVPGAIPGALPVVFGYLAVRETFWTSECLYLFLIMFLWQMPHFWVIAMRFKDDYAKAGIPVLPNKVGVERTLFQIGLYLFVYVGLAIASPWFVDTKYFYLLLVVPLSIKLLVEFFRFLEKKTSWLKFFMWINASVIVFLLAPLFDKWHALYLMW